MFRELQLTNFKNFRDASLELGPFTVLVGANASGKSNLRDAFRFLHGVGRGYDLVEILDKKYSEGSGEKTWDGIRGGVAGVSYKTAPFFELDARLSVPPFASTYFLRVDLIEQSENGQTVALPRIKSERLGDPNARTLARIYETEEPAGGDKIPVSIFGTDMSREPGETGPWPDQHDMSRHRPILSQLADSYPESEIGSASAEFVRKRCDNTKQLFENMRFVELNPHFLRSPAHVGQRTLGNRGQNLAPVLMEICKYGEIKTTLVEWVETLTPMDAKDFDFEVAEHSSEVTLTLIEKDGTRTPMQSASDGTLRFLGLLALLFSRDAAPRLLFIEEIETGLHPTRLDLLANLIEQRTEQTETQVIATTHSPQFLEVLDEETLEDAQLVYRTGDGPEAKICPLLEVPTAREVLAKPRQNVGELHRSGWFENAMAFSGEKTVSS